MMTFPHKMQVNYTITEKMEMIELPYRNGTVSLLIILPNEIDDLRAVEESITIDNLKMWQDFPTINRGINIHIPKFTLETEYDLTQQLPDMGMPTVFNPVHADLSGITGYKSLYVSQAIHKAFVEVNEKGTEAAGATVIVTDESGGQTFRADHPFVFIIQDNETDNILFMGRVVDPT
jgi:serpin B